MFRDAPPRAAPVKQIDAPRSPGRVHGPIYPFIFVPLHLVAGAHRFLPESVIFCNSDIPHIVTSGYKLTPHHLSGLGTTAWKSRQ